MMKRKAAFLLAALTAGAFCMGGMTACGENGSGGSLTKSNIKIGLICLHD